MIYKILADAVVSIHFLWIMFIIFGAFLGARYKFFRVFHLSGLAFALLIQVPGWYCPLTYLEVWLRSKHDPSLAYSGSFIVHYFEKVIYLIVPREMVIVITILLCGLNLWIYFRKTAFLRRVR